MTICGKRLTRGKDSEGKDIIPTVSYTCEIPIPEGKLAHEGPCASPSDLTSVNARKRWEREHENAEAAKRHRESGLGQTQSLPMSSQSIANFEQKPHPSSETQCPFCSERPMHKDLMAHIMVDHHGAREQEVAAPPLPPPSPSEKFDPTQSPGAKVAQAVPQPPIPQPPVGTTPNESKEPSSLPPTGDAASSQEGFDWYVVNGWIKHFSEHKVPEHVLIAWSRIAEKHAPHGSL